MAAADASRIPSAGDRRLAFLILAVASLVTLPIVYLGVERGLGPFAAFGAGIVSMSLAWAAGCALQWRRLRTMVGVLALGMLQPALVALPPVAAREGPVLTLTFVSAALVVVAAGVLARARRQASS